MRLGLALACSALAIGCTASSGPSPTSAASAPAASAPMGANKVDGAYLTSGGDGSDWAGPAYSYSEQRFSPLAQLTDANVSELGIAWYADLPDLRGQEATPVVVDGVLYLSGPWSKVWAFDAATGAKLWDYDPQVPKEWLVHSCCDAVNRGVSVWKGRVYVGVLDGRLIALDAKTGKEAWSVQTTDPKMGQYAITGFPRVVKDMVIIGNGGADLGARGFVTAYDAATGAKKWRFYTVPRPDGQPDGEVSDAALRTARPSWSDKGAWTETGGGGTVWDAIVYDPELDQLYLGVGNGSPWNYQLRTGGKGDNLFLASVVALKPETGEYLWHYQETPKDNWDFTSTQPIMLADLTIGGSTRKVLMHAPKNGFFFMIDRTTGKLISADPYVSGVNWAKGYGADGRPIINPASYYGVAGGKLWVGSPGAMGAHSWHPMSYSPRTGLVYIPANLAGFPYPPPIDRKDLSTTKLGFNAGLDWAGGAAPRDVEAIKAMVASTRGALVAWDPVRRKEAWRVDYPAPWNSGTLATAGNLVFQGTAMGRFQAFAADSGRLLWSIPTQTGPMAAPSTFTVRGEQMVAFTTGKGGAFAISPGKAAGPYNKVPNIARLIVLKRGGSATLPPAPAVEAAELNPPKATGTKAQIANGKRLYARMCSVCHGDSVTSGGVNPDLRHSGAIADAAAWKAIVIDGALRENGMASFAPAISAWEAESIRHYVIDQAIWDKAHPLPKEAGG